MMFSWSLAGYDLGFIPERLELLSILLDCFIPLENKLFSGPLKLFLNNLALLLLIGLYTLFCFYSYSSLSNSFTSYNISSLSGSLSSYLAYYEGFYLNVGIGMSMLRRGDIAILFSGSETVR